MLLLYYGYRFTTTPMLQTLFKNQKLRITLGIIVLGFLIIWAFIIPVHL